jgi:hypothetical protein
MGYMDRYRKSRQDLEGKRAIWNPETKAVILPSGVVVWLGGKPDSPPTAFRLVWDDGTPVGLSTVLAKYAAKGVLPKGTTVFPAEPKDVTGGSPETALKILQEVPEPYRSKLSAWLLPLT